MLAYRGKVMRRLASVLIGAPLLLALGGCPSQDENALVVFGPDSVVVLAPLAVPAFLLPPEGSATANALELVSFDPVALDAFGRSGPLFGSGVWPFWNGSWWSWGTDFGTQGWGTADTDPRKPTLTQLSADISFDFMYIPPQGVFAGDGYDIYGEWCCAPPGQNYVVGLERSVLQVNGELDAAQVLLGQAVSEPDSLYPFDNTVGGDPFRLANQFNTGAAYPSEAGVNRFLLGAIQSCPLGTPWGVSCAGLGVPDGYVIIDVVVACTDAGGAQVWMCDTSEDPATSLVAPNNATRFSLPNYNYMTIWFANPDGTPDYSRPLVRYQLGVDLSALGGPINNAYAPFPEAPLSDAELALGTGAVSRPDSVTFVFDNLKELSGGAAYMVWARLDDGSYQGLNFLYTPEGGTQSTTTSFVGGEGTHEVMVEYPDNATHIVVSVEGSTGAAMPSAAQILWATGLQAVGEAKTLGLPVDFGTFGQRVWAISGTGSGGLFGNEFRERFEHLPRPPVGYKYVGWLSSGDTLFTRLADETFTSPPPEYAVLSEADVDDTISEVVQPLEIVTAFTRFCVREQTTGCVGPIDLGAYDTFFLTLEPKAGMPDEPAPTKVLEAATPTPKGL